MNASSLSLQARVLRHAVRWLIAPALDTDRPLAGRRRRLEFVTLLSRFPMPAGTQIEPADFGGVRGEWIRNNREPALRTVLYLHGGGYQVGSVAVYRGFAAQIARAWQADVALVEYRLAPEHPFPAATDDVFAAYRSLLSRQNAGGGELIVAGDSAGGGLSVACALQARDAGVTPPTALVVFSPWLDLTISGRSANERAHDDMLGSAHLRIAAQAYLSGANAQSPLASALHADLHGLPPTLIQVTDNELLYDDARRFADALHAAGTPAQLRVWSNLWHVWQLFAGRLPEADAALAQAEAFIAEHSGA